LLICNVGANKQAQIEAKPNVDCHLLYLTFYLTFGEIARLGEIEGWLRTRSKQEIRSQLHLDKKPT
jgi:hypothetical protein